MDSAGAVTRDTPTASIKNSVHANILSGYDGDVITLGEDRPPMAHGYGTWTFKTGKVSGRWALGNPVGNMSMTFTDRQGHVTYRGELKVENGKCIAHGNGKQERVYQDGVVRVFDGTWSAGKCVNGKATMGKSENGEVTLGNTVYEGTFDDFDDEIVRGTRICDDKGPDGANVTEKYEGEFKNWGAHGAGSRIFTSDATSITEDGIFAKDALFTGQRYILKCNGLSQREVIERNAIIMTCQQTSPDEATITWTREKTYKGPVQNWRPHGKGEMLWLNGDKYEGEFQNGLIHGFGTITWNTGDKKQHSYTGFFAEGKRTGEGTYQWPDGKTCQGNWIAGVPTGDVTITYPDKKIYQGPVNAKSEPHEGSGKMIFADRTCSGKWNNGNPTKNMSLIYSDGSRYSGKVNYQYQPGGPGTMTMPDGTEKTGIWDNVNLKSAAVPAQPVSENSQKTDPTLHSAKKAVSKKDQNPKLPGVFKGGINTSGQPDGQGEMHLKDGTIVSGKWTDGRSNGEMKVVSPDRRCYVGPIRLEKGKYQPHGMGTMSWPDGRTCTGSWDCGTPEGKMVMLYLDGTQFKGELNSDYQPDRQGTMSWPDSFSEKSCKGIWENGIPKKVVTLTCHDGKIFTGMVNPSYEPHGQGKMTWPDDENVVSCTGFWRDGETLGQVTMAYRNGDSYQGSLDSNYRPDKKGKYTWHDGKIYEGDSKDGKPHGNGSYKLPGKYTYAGSLAGGQMHGHGVLDFEGGERFEGTFRQGRIDGPGKLLIDGFTYAYDNFTELVAEELSFESATITWKDGHYKGPVKDGRPDGDGELTWRGKVYPGPFDEGQKNIPAAVQFPGR